MTLKGGTSQACAACKYQRRKCTSECLLAPYFPPDQTNTFRNAHKLFGVSNILKILTDLEPHQKPEAMHSIIYQANARDRFPVNGCCEIISRLCYQIQLLEEELHVVHAQLEMYRQHSLHQIESSMPDDVTSQLEFGMVHNKNALTWLNYGASNNCNVMAAVSLPVMSTENNNGGCNNSSGYNNMESKDKVSNTLWVQHPSCNNNNNNITNNSNNNNENENNNCYSMAIQSPLVGSNNQQPLAIQQVVEDDHYDDMHPFFHTIDDRQSYVDSKEAYESSSEESLKDIAQSIEIVAENEVKNDAACFIT